MAFHLNNAFYLKKIVQGILSKWDGFSIMSDFYGRKDGLCRQTEFPLYYKLTHKSFTSSSSICLETSPRSLPLESKSSISFINFSSHTVSWSSTYSSEVGDTLLFCTWLDGWNRVRAVNVYTCSGYNQLVYEWPNHNLVSVEKQRYNKPMVTLKWSFVISRLEIKLCEFTMSNKTNNR